MFYTFYGIDDKNKIIYLKIKENIISKEMLSSFENDYQRIIEYANKNNYTIKYMDKEIDSYEDIFSFKKKL